MTRPSTPYFVYCDDNDPPPSYASSSISDSPPESSSSGSPRLSHRVIDVGGSQSGRASLSDDAHDLAFGLSDVESESQRTSSSGNGNSAVTRHSAAAPSTSSSRYQTPIHSRRGTAVFANFDGQGTKKGKERERTLSGYTTPAHASHSSCNSVDYAVPSVGNYHYRSGPLARKLGSAIPSREGSFTDLHHLLHSANSSPGSGSSRRRSGWKSPRRKDGDMFDSLSFTGLDTALPIASTTSRRTKRSCASLFPFPGAIKAWHRFCRYPLVPTQPLTILFALGLFASFAYSVTTFMYHILSTDKAPRPWRAYCQEQRPFPHELADALNPVDVFVGVFSVDAAYERRHLIRSTYLRHSKPIDPYTGRPGNNVQVKFILGRPRRHHARRVALEMETYNDIVVLDTKENMNQGKTHTFFKWANENATVPIYYKAPTGKRHGALTPSGDSNVETYNVAFKKADYVVKADDDAFLVLSELERHLRVAPREKMYWGYLIRNLFMAGECYALSADLVNYVATSPLLESYTTGAEDKRVAKWMRMHPNASSINWITERCYVHDHPKAATTYSHGFLFPDEVERVRAEGRTGISEAEKARRGGVHSEAWSTVSKWKKPYGKPKSEMTMEEEVEALIEGGGRWSALDGWANKISSDNIVAWENVVFDHADQRIKGSIENIEKANQARAANNAKHDMAFGKYNRMPNSLIRDPGESDVRPQHAKRSPLAFWKRSSEAEEDLLADDAAAVLTSSAIESFHNITEATSKSLYLGSDSEVASSPSSAAAPTNPLPGQQNHHNQQVISPPNYKQGYSLFPDHQPEVSAKRKAISAPHPRYDHASMSVRERRFLGLPYGGTVVVHYLKRNEWFLETALVLLGRERMWDAGVDAPYYPSHVPVLPKGRTHHPQPRPEKQAVIASVPASNVKGDVEIASPQWGGARMYGSPLVKENGYIALGRTVPWDALKQAEKTKYGSLQGNPRQRFVSKPATGVEEGSETDDDLAEKQSQENDTPSDSHTHAITLSA